MRNLLKLGRGALAMLALVPNAVLHAAPTVMGMQLIGEKRVSRTVFDYTYRLTIQNDGSTRRNVAVQVGAVGAGTSVQDGAVTVGDLAANQQIVAADTVTLRHDRVLPFSQAAVTWIFTGTEVPPEGNPPPGILVPGNPTAKIGDAMPNHDSSRVVPASEISVDSSSGYRIIRTALYIVFRQESTVSDVNAVLNSINGRILSSFAGNGAVSVGIPDPGGLPALYALIDNLRKRPEIEIVLPDDIAEPESLPQEGYSANTLSLLDHHLAIRGAAAWNARKALIASGSQPPSFLIYDTFGNGAPQADFSQVNWKLGAGTGFSTSCNPFQLDDPSTPTIDEDTTDCQHAYHVTGIALGNFGGTGNIGQVTGMYPSGGMISTVVDGYAIDRWTVWTGQKTQMRRALENISGRIVINTSMSERLKCDPQVDDALAIAHGRFWLRLLRGGNIAQPSPFEARFFHAAAAANNTCGGFEKPVAGIVDAPAKRVGKFAASWTAASLYSDAELGGPALTNTVVVENRKVAPSLPAPAASAARPDCTYLGTAVTGTNGVVNPHYGASYSGGHVAGIGSRADSVAGVWSYLDAGPTQAGASLGTSMSTPQVAGLAIYLWTLRPDLTGQELAERIKAHVVPVSCTGDFSNTPVVDAYATILSADEGFTSNNNPAREAMLDVNEDGKFDDQDTQVFLDAIFAPIAGQTADYSRYDLNGDGFTGGPKTAALNLDMSYDAQGRSTYSILTSAQNAFPLRVDEAQVSDFEVLCYYVNSKFFSQGSLGAFEEQLKVVRETAGRARVTCASPVAATITLSDSLLGWTGMPGTAQVDTLQAVSISRFQAFGNNSCQFGERGGPIFSSTVDADAVFFGASNSSNVPAQIFPGINRRNCSSFVAYKNLAIPGAIGPQVKLWINATGRAVAFSGSITLDWEYQTRLFSDGTTTTCRVGVVPGSGNFSATYTTNNCIGRILFAPTQ
ncbi:hypothetical protein [Massilia sp. KIM]|uniref:hypothetical protein n=1 Tax=Massilia sp. KIM TaxID=1955422 RepID=UPI00117F3795|nr:hypothetical protein [Massilia sp. KIM]